MLFRKPSLGWIRPHRIRHHITGENLRTGQADIFDEYWEHVGRYSTWFAFFIFLFYIPALIIMQRVMFFGKVHP